MCRAHQTGVSRFSVALVALIVLLLFLGAAITGTCSLSCEGNLLRHTSPPATHSHAGLMPSMAGMHTAACVDPACPMHHGPAALAHAATCLGTACTEPPTAALLSPALPTLAPPPAAVPVLFPLDAPAPRRLRTSPPPLLAPRTSRPATLRL